MNTPKLHLNRIATRKVLVLALMAAFGSAHADEEIDKLIKPDTASVSAGVAGALGSRKDRSIFGQYNGWSDTDSAVLLDFEYVKREDATGTWTKAEGRNLGQDNRELRFTSEVQGQYRVTGEYNEQVRHDPLTLNTGLQGIGSTTPTAVKLLTPGAGSDVNLDLKRKAYSLSSLVWISPNFTAQSSVKVEDKDGARLSGIGGYCSDVIAPFCSAANSTVSALFLLPEPVKSTTKQFEIELHYFKDKLSLTGGYYGSYYEGANNSVGLGVAPGVLAAVPGVTEAALASNLSQAFALPPDNQAHQFYLSGTYALQPTTRANFKVALTHATQNESFGNLGVGSLDGAIDTTLVQAGLTMRPMSELTLNFSGRYEDKEDKTRLGKYLVDGAGTLYTNTPNNSTRASGKAEALYQFSSKYRGLLAVDYAYINRDRPVATTLIPSTSMAALRERTNEVGVRAELRRSMSETINGAVSIGHSERDGYRWYALGPTSGYAFISNSAASSLSGTFPMTMVDRNRDNFKVSADWAASEALSIQASLDQGTDHFKGPTSAGVHNADAYSFNVDASYKLDDKWALTGYVSSGQQTLGVSQQLGYTADLTNVSTAYGLGATGKLSSKLEVGGSLSYTEDINRYKIGMSTGAAVTNPPPDENYRGTVLKLYGKYALDKASDVQVDLIHQHVEYDQWAWGNGGVPFTYTDNSTVSTQPVQNVTVIGVRYVYKFK